MDLDPFHTKHKDVIVRRHYFDPISFLKTNFVKSIYICASFLYSSCILKFCLSNVQISSFYRLCDDFAWAKVPLLRRLPDLENNLKVTIVYGEDSWVDPKLSKTILENAGVKNIDRFDIIMIPNARHHVYADQYSIFNSVMVQTLNSS